MKRLSMMVILAGALGGVSLSAQYAQQQRPNMQRPLPSGSLTVTPAAPATNQAMTFRGTLNNPPFYIEGRVPQSPHYLFIVRTAANAEVWRRDFASSDSATWSPTTVGSYYALGAIRTFKLDGTEAAVYDLPRRNFTVSSPLLTWTTAITAETLGSTPPSHLNGRKISDIINSTVAGRVDGQKCNVCHTANTTNKMYRPNTASTIQPGTTINSGNALGTTYSWNQSGPTGIVKRFCVAAGKPSDLCSVFEKWAADGYRSQ